nr:TIGR03826 family flagellar region protein [Bacillus sp. REN3]
MTNCPQCGEIFVKNKFRDTCEKCWKAEQDAYDTVSKFIKKRENRTASILQVEEGTGVSEELILKFIKTGKLQIAQFPNLGYPCDKCGSIIRQGKLCSKCAGEIKADLKAHEHEETRKKEIANRTVTFFTHRD